MMVAVPKLSRIMQVPNCHHILQPTQVFHAYPVPVKANEFQQLHDSRWQQADHQVETTNAQADSGFEIIS